MTQAAGWLGISPDHYRANLLRGRILTSLEIHSHVRASTSQRQRNRFPDAARGTGHKSDFVGEGGHGGSVDLRHG